MMKKIKINLKNWRGTDREREKGKNIELNVLESEMLRKKHIYPDPCDHLQETLN